MFIPEQQDEHWLIIVLGQFAGVMETVFSFACGVFIIYFLQYQYPVLDNTVFVTIALFTLVFFLNFFLVLIHELGHALAAWSVRRRVHLICVGYLGFMPRAARFVWVGKSDEAEYAGFVSTSPVWPDFSKVKSIWISLGGPLATGLTSVLIMIFWNGAGPSIALKLALSGFFLMDMVVNLLPMRWRGGSASDGLRIWLSWTDNLWTPDIWAATRLGVVDRGNDIVSGAEWAELRKLVKQPFYGGAEFRQLLFVAALGKNDTEMLGVLGVMAKANAVDKAMPPQST